MMSYRTVAFAILAVATLSLGGMTPAQAGDVAKGEKVFKKCRACHSLRAGKKKVGPSLHGVFGRRAGRFVDARGRAFKHSKDMKAAGAAGLVWSEDTFKRYIAKPKPYIGTIIGKKKAKTKMAFNGLKKPVDVDNLFAYLEPFLMGQQEGK